jgi:hypothetical protein
MMEKISVFTETLEGNIVFFSGLQKNTHRIKVAGLWINR